MAYDGKIMHRALQRFEEDRQARNDRFLQRREDIFRRQPRLREIDRELKSTMSHIISGALRRGTDPRPAIERLRDENLSLQAEKRTLLDAMGLSQDCLEELPACALCGDTGYRNGQVCRCLRNYYAQEQQKELSRMLDLGNQSFDTFSMDWYSRQYDSNMGGVPYDTMEIAYDACVDFAYNFGKKPANLLLFGAPGLGKTHLSASIAREVSAKGYSVVYDTASHVFQCLEKQKFSRDEDDQSTADVDRIFVCDLLILDDLGTEMTTAFVQSALYQIVNTRLMERRSTIISTNLSPDMLAKRYSLQILSRIEGEYRLLPFMGKDIRKQKRAQNDTRAPHRAPEPPRPLGVWPK